MGVVNMDKSLPSAPVRLEATMRTSAQEQVLSKSDRRLHLQDM